MQNLKMHRPPYDADTEFNQAMAEQSSETADVRAGGRTRRVDFDLEHLGSEPIHFLVYESQRCDVKLYNGFTEFHYRIDMAVSRQSAGGPGWHFLRLSTSGTTLWCFHNSISRKGVWMGFPLWLPLLPFVVTSVVAWWSKPILLNYCEKCEYDLTGNESGVCPECGNTVDNGTEA